jgi:HEAT repeat protein
VLALYLADTPLSQPAHAALVWLADPAIVRPLLEQIEKDPKRIVRHAGLFQGPLAGRPAEPILVKLLDSPDAGVRYPAAYAVFECNDATLAQPIARFAKEADPRLRSAARTLAMHLADDAFASIRSDLAPLLSSEDNRLCLEAITCFAKRKDFLAGPPILRLLKQDRIDAGQAVTVMQALNALADSAFSYDMHNWGPKANGKAVARFEAWLRQRGCPVDPGTTSSPGS